jgi:membrane protease YdiL (CAAX protease family)
MNLIQNGNLYNYPKAPIPIRIINILTAALGFELLWLLVGALGFMANSDADVEMVSSVAKIITLCAVIPLWIRHKKRFLPNVSINYKVPKALIAVMIIMGVSWGSSILSDLFVISTANTSDFVYSHWLLVHTVILSPILEEIIMRGFVLNRALAVFPKWLAIIISAIIFGISHFNLPQGIATTIGGLFFALIYVRYRSIVICIIAHSVVNIMYLITHIFYDIVSPHENLIISILLGVSLIGFVLFIVSKGAELTPAKRDSSAERYEAP